MPVTDSTSGDGERKSIPHARNSISVVIPAYNAAKYLSEALNSVLSQTLPPDEILVIDDGSTDDTVAVASAFPDVRVASYENAGPSAGRNRGIALATGDWVAFLDHDDLWLPQKLEKQMQMLNRHPDADVCVTGNQVFHDVDGKRLFAKGRLLPPSEKLGRSLYGETRLCPSFVMIRRSRLLAVGDFERKQRQAEDWDYWLRLEQAGARFVSCPEALGFYRVHATNASRNAWLMYEGELETYERRIAPGIHPFLRPFHRLSARSRFLAGISIEERSQGRPHLRIMLRSIITWPFGKWSRYITALHMCMQKMRLLKLFQFLSGNSLRRGLPEHHLFQLDQLLRFIGSTTIAPSAMFPQPWPTKPGTLAQLLYGVYFLLMVLLNSKKKVLVYSLGPDFLSGETRLTDRNLRRRALWAASHHKPFLIVSSDDARPIETACSRLGIDATEELTAYMVINVVLIFFATKNGSPVVIHVGAGSPDVGLIAERYRQWVETTNSCSVPPSIRHLIPEVISFSGADGYWIVVQSRVPGRPEALPTGDQEFYEFLERLLGPLLEFRSTAAEHVEGADHKLIFETFPAMANQWPDLKEMVDALVTRLQDWQRARRLTPILTHGDYWIRNLLIVEPGGEVTGIVDWDRSRRYGTPGFDALHLVMTALVERKGYIADYLGQVWTGKWESDLLAAYVARVQREYGLSDEDIRNLGAMLYLNELVRMHFNHSQLSREHLQKFRDLEPAIRAWLARSEPDVSPSLTSA